MGRQKKAIGVVPFLERCSRAFGHACTTREKKWSMTQGPLANARQRISVQSHINKTTTYFPSRTAIAMSDSEEPLEELEGNGEDLFGDEGDDDLPPTSKERDLDDDLASDPDEDADTRQRAYEDDDNQPHETRDRVVMATQTYRHQIPNPKDGTV